jgi:D-alanyl-D-alanine carboxypeptidase (penicillin-binding protein 5/6)
MKLHRSTLLFLAAIPFLGSIVQATTNPPPDVKGASIIVVDVNSGDILFERNADEKRPVASTQKLLTSLLVAEHGNLDKKVVIQPIDEATEPTKLQLIPGTSYSRRDLLTALLVKSPNDVARALGRDYAGSIEKFATVMNEKAHDLGMNSSHFVNPNGLPDPAQHSTARDMSKVALAVHANPILAPIMTIKYLNFRYADGHIYLVRNTNETMRDNWFCTGMKTGYTELAKHCLVSSGAANGKEVIVVYLGGTKERTFSDSAKLLRWALNIPSDKTSSLGTQSSSTTHKPTHQPTPKPTPKPTPSIHKKPSASPTPAP